MIARNRRGDGSRRVERQAGRRAPTLFWHCIQCVPVLIWIIGVCGMPVWVYVACFVYPGMSLAMVRSFAEHRSAARAGEAHRDRRERAHSRAAVPLQQPACRPSPARRAAVVSDSDVLPAEPRRADRSQRGPGLSLVFRRRAALPADAARPHGPSRLGRPRRMSGGAAGRGAADVRLAGDRRGE